MEFLRILATCFPESSRRISMGDRKGLGFCFNFSKKWGRWSTFRSERPGLGASAADFRIACDKGSDSSPTDLLEVGGVLGEGKRIPERSSFRRGLQGLGILHERMCPQIGKGCTRWRPMECTGNRYSTREGSA